MDWPPHMLGSSERRGNIVNVYTEPEFRRRGLARRLVEAALEWCKKNNIDFVILHASDQGRSLYESLGFQPSNEMRVRLQKSEEGSRDCLRSLPQNHSSRSPEP
jgi:GNAT superfamily N-acetyltransferase